MNEERYRMYEAGQRFNAVLEAMVGREELAQMLRQRQAHEERERQELREIERRLCCPESMRG